MLLIRSVSLSLSDDSTRSLGVCGWIFIFISIIFTVALCPVTIFMCIKVCLRSKAIVMGYGKTAVSDNCHLESELLVWERLYR